MFSLPIVPGVLVEAASEIALLLVFVLGWFVFRYEPVRRFLGYETVATPEELAVEKALAADFSSGQPALVVERSKQLSCPSEEALHYVASAQLELDPQAVPAACAVLLKKNPKLSLDVIVSAVMAQTGLSLAVFEALLPALTEMGAIFPKEGHVRALLDRGASVADLSKRFGDVAYCVRAEQLAEAQPPQPAELLAVFQAAPLVCSFRVVFDSLVRAQAEELSTLVSLPEVHQLPAAEMPELLAAVPWKTALDLLTTWRAGAGNVSSPAMYAPLTRFDSAEKLEAVTTLAGLDGVLLADVMPDVARVRAVMASLRRCTDASLARGLAAKLEPCPLVVANMALDICVKARDLTIARQIFASMPTATRDVVTYNTLLKGEALAGQWDQARALLASMTTDAVTGNHVTFNTLMHACVSQKASPWQFVAAMENQGLRPDAITVTTLVRTVQGPSDAAHLRRCIGYVEAGIGGVDAGLFDALVDACARARNRDLLTEALALATTFGVPVSRGNGALLRTAGSLPAAWAIWNDLTETGATEYSQMVAVCTAHKGLQEARDLCAQATTRGFAISAASASALVKAYVQQKEVASAGEVFEQLLRDLRAAGTPLHLPIFNSLLDAWSRVGDMARAEQLWNLGEDLQVDPDLISFSTLVKGYCVTGDLERALGIFGQLRRRGLRPDSVLFHSILDGCANRQMEELAENVYQDMLRDGHKPSNVTLSILVKLYGRTSLERAREAVTDLPAQFDFKPNAQVWTCLISVALTHRNVGEAIRVKREMEAAGCRPDAKCFQTLLKGCLRLQRLEEAAEIAEEAMALPNGLDAGLLNDLLFVLERRGLSDVARRLRAASGQSVPVPRPAPRTERNWRTAAIQ